MEYLFNIFFFFFDQVSNGESDVSTPHDCNNDRQNEKVDIASFSAKRRIFKRYLSYFNSSEKFTVRLIVSLLFAFVFRIGKLLQINNRNILRRDMIVVLFGDEANNRSFDQALDLDESSKILKIYEQVIGWAWQPNPLDKKKL